MKDALKVKTNTKTMTRETVVKTTRGNVIKIDESKKPTFYLREIWFAKSLYYSGVIDYDMLVIAAERYIESVKLWAKRNDKIAPSLSVAKLLR